MSEQIVDADGDILKSRRVFGYTLCLLILACLSLSPQIILVLILENLEMWIGVMVVSTSVTIIRICLPVMGPTWTIFIIIDCFVRFSLMRLFRAYWNFWDAVLIGKTPSEPLPPSILGVPIGMFIAILTSYTISLSIWRSKQIKHPAHTQNQHSQRPVPEAAQTPQRTPTSRQQSSSETRSRAVEAAQAARDREHSRERERRSQEEQRRNLEEARRRRQQAANASASTITAFSKWREDCRTLLQAPELITNMPQPPHPPCSRNTCNTRSSYLGLCSHGLRKLYETSKLEERELKDELRLWHPNGAKVNQVGESCKAQVLGMSNEIAHVLQEMLKTI
jgi:hypothetical protein